LKRRRVFRGYCLVYLLGAKGTAFFHRKLTKRTGKLSTVRWKWFLTF
jgi:hypothetical protein